MRKSMILLGLGLLAIAGCDQSVRQAHEAVKKELNDPDSAQFRNDRVMSKRIVCGEVNAKNRVGGYVGFSPYVAFVEDVIVVDIGENAKDYCDESSIRRREEERKEREELSQHSSRTTQSLHHPRPE